MNILRIGIELRKVCPIRAKCNSMRFFFFSFFFNLKKLNEIYFCDKMKFNTKNILYCVIFLMKKTNKNILYTIECNHKKFIKYNECINVLSCGKGKKLRKYKSFYSV